VHAQHLVGIMPLLCGHKGCARGVVVSLMLSPSGYCLCYELHRNLHQYMDKQGDV